MAVLLISFLLLMVLGCPIAFCLLGSGTLYFLANDMALIMVVQRLTEGANTFTLLAVPGFILAGNLMNSGEVTDRIFDFCGKLVGHITGGLGLQACPARLLRMRAAWAPLSLRLCTMQATTTIFPWQ